MYIIFVQRNLICLSIPLVRGGYFFGVLMKKNKIEDEIQILLNHKCDEWSTLTIQKEKSLSCAPAGRLRMSRNANKMQCFLVTGKTSLHGEYIPVGKMKMAKSLAQKDYDKRILKEMRLQLKAARKFAGVYSPERIDAVYTCLSPARRSLVNPVRLPDADYVALWQSERYLGKTFADDNPGLQTCHGEYVRSKSELIIADALFRFGVPYKYERPIDISTKKGKIRVFPDFTCLNVRLRKEIIWEHFGKMDDAEYSSKVTQKINSFLMNNFMMGDNLIFSMESECCAFDAKKAEMLIKKFLL